MAKNITHHVISWIFGILAIILLVFLVNVFSFFIEAPIAKDLVSFLNSNLILIILISFLFFLGSLFFYFGFPINLLTPIFDAVGGGLLVVLIASLIILIDSYVPIGIGSFLKAYSSTIAAIISFIILIFGFMAVLQNYSRRREFKERREHEEEIEEIIEEDSDKNEPSLKKKPKRRITRRRVRR
jgi:hypothetical protein